MRSGLARHLSQHPPVGMGYDFAKPWTLTVPQQLPALSMTGKLVVRCSWSFRRPSSTDSSAPQQAEEGRMISSTRTSDACRSSATTPQHTSRSVTTPTSLRSLVSATTGAQPHPESRIARAACTAVSFGVQHEAGSMGFITSLQQLISCCPSASSSGSWPSTLYPPACAPSCGPSCLAAFSSWHPAWSGPASPFQ